MASKRFLVLPASLAGPVAVGALSGLSTASGLSGWYPALRKPSFNPPSAVFGPVWTVLYLLMGVTLYRLLRSPRGPARNRALGAFGAQLALNAAWSPLFFRFHRIGGALLDIVALWGAIVAMIRAVRKVDAPAAWPQIPYLLWVTFATALNGALWHLNRE
jgi:tryptophan-rich sensory protein